ncbi:MAG: DUF2868 domain-containing protein [Planctomycetes bacterium]|nr:DUF2868 domain-containing protein [Planctomycetota bacterium]
MRIALIIDLEAQFERDASVSAAGRQSDLAARDAAVGARIAAAHGASVADMDARARSHDRVLAAVLAAWRQQAGGAERPGRRYEHGMKVAAGILALLAVVVGGSACLTTLHYDGNAPVNVLWFLGIFVVGQVGLLALMTIALARSTGSVLAWLLRVCAQSRWVARQRADLADGAGAAAARFERHADVERWTLFVLAQCVAVAGNVAALAVLLGLVAFTDLAFCWSSTAFDSATVMRNLTQAVAAPWAWCLPDAVPAVALVEQTQWVRMPGAYIGGATLAEAASASRAWWPFLAVALAVWGLLPRVCAWAFGAWRVRRIAVASLRRDPRCLAVLARLFPLAGWSGPAAAEVGAPAHDRLDEGAIAPFPEPAAGERGWLLCWGRLAAAIPELARRYGPALGVRAVGGSDVAADDDACRALAQAKAMRVLLLCAAGVQPNKEVLDLLAALRRHLGPHALLEVALVDDGDPALPPAAPTAGNARAWQQVLVRRGDPALCFVRLEPTA